MFHLPLFGDQGATSIFLTKEEERTLQLLNAALRVLNKSMYIFWIRYFREGEGRRKAVMTEAQQSYSCRGSSF